MEDFFQPGPMPGTAGEAAWVGARHGARVHLPLTPIELTLDIEHEGELHWADLSDHRDGNPHDRPTWVDLWFNDQADYVAVFTVLGVAKTTPDYWGPALVGSNLADHLASTANSAAHHVTDGPAPYDHPHGTDAFALTVTRNSAVTYPNGAPTLFQSAYSSNGPDGKGYYGYFVDEDEHQFRLVRLDGVWVASPSRGAGAHPIADDIFATVEKAARH